MQTYVTVKAIKSRELRDFTCQSVRHDSRRSLRAARGVGAEVFRGCSEVCALPAKAHGRQLVRGLSQACESCQCRCYEATAHGVRDVRRQEPLWAYVAVGMLLGVAEMCCCLLAFKAKRWAVRKPYGARTS